MQIVLLGKKCQGTLGSRSDTYVKFYRGSGDSPLRQTRESRPQIPISMEQGFP